VTGRSGLKTCQLEPELNALIDLAKKNNVQRYLEIGARFGDTFYDIMTSLPIGSIGVCVDLPASLWGSNNSQSYLLEACTELIKQGYKIECILGNSTSPEVLQAVYDFSDFYDLVLIDGDHTYKGVKADYLNYSERAGFVALHDIAGYGQRHSEGINVEVPRFWEEIKAQKEHSWEFIAKGSKMGVGVVSI